MRSIKCALLLCLLAAPARAAYTTAIVAATDPPTAQGVVHIVITCGGGNAGEPNVNVDVYMQGQFSVQSDIQTQAWNTCDSAARNVAVRGLLTVGQSLTRFVPTPPAAVGPALYRVSTQPFTPGTAPTDVCTLSGSATKTVTVNRMWIATMQTTAGFNVWLVGKRSTADTGGTSTTKTAVAFDTLSPASSAVMRTYTANATALGTLVGLYDVRIVPSPTTTAAPSSEPRVEVAMPQSAQYAVLRGVAEGIGWNFNGAALPAGLQVACGFEWSEQ